MKSLQKRSVSILLCVALLLTGLTGLQLSASAEVAEDIIVGGDFEAPSGDAIYKTNFGPRGDGYGLFNKKTVSIVDDPVNPSGGNHCVKLPAGEKLDQYLGGLVVEAGKTYNLSVDVYGGAVAFYINVSGYGTRRLAATDRWTRYTIAITIPETADVSKLQAWGISFIRSAELGNNGEDAYIDNVTFTPAPAAAAPDLIDGGTFDFADASTVYDRNWKGSVFGASGQSMGVRIVRDPTNEASANRCLMLPKVSTAQPDLYVRGMALEPNSEYTLKFDIYGGKVGFYFSPAYGIKTGAGTRYGNAATKWTTTKLTFTTGSDANVLAANQFGLYGIAILKRNKDGWTTGDEDTYLDNVTLYKSINGEPIMEAPAEKPTLTAAKLTPELVTNGDFETAGEETRNFSALIKGGAEVVVDQKDSTNHCLALPAGVAFDRYLQNISYEKGAIYTLSFDARGGQSSMYHFANRFTCFINPRSISASEDWTHYSFRFEANATVDTVPNYVIGFVKNSTATQEAITYIDNVSFRKIGAMVDMPPENGTLTLSTLKEPEKIGSQAVTAPGGTVTVTATPAAGYMLKPGSLIIVDEDGNGRRVLNKLEEGTGTGSGTTYRFTQPDHAVAVRAEFIPADTDSFSLKTIGTSLFKTGDDITGVRFLTRLQFENLNLNEDTLTVTYDGKQHTVAEIGALLKRSDNRTELELDNVGGEGENRIWKAVAYDGNTLRINDYTDTYLDFSVSMTTPESSDEFTSRQYRICGYMILDDGTIVYGNALEDSADAASKRSSIMRVYNDDWRSHPQDFKLIAIGLDGDPHHKEVADDVPLIRILNAVNNNENGSVTLNIAGDNLRANGDKIIRYAIDVCGAEIGTYTWNATKLPTLSNEERYEWISSAVAYTEETLGVEIRFLRPPYISGSAEVWETCRQLGLTAYGMNRVWTTDPADTAEMLAGAYDGAFWLLHAHAASVPGAIEEAVPILVKQGYRFCTMSELFEYMGEEPVPGRMYNTGVMHD